MGLNEHEKLWIQLRKEGEPKSRLRQFFCRHNYIIPKKHDDQEERDRLVRELKEGQAIAFSRLHRCKKCGKEKMIGSGLIF